MQGSAHSLCLDCAPTAPSGLDSSTSSLGSALPFQFELNLASTPPISGLVSSGALVTRQHVGEWIFASTKGYLESYLAHLLPCFAIVCSLHWNISPMEAWILVHFVSCTSPAPTTAGTAVKALESGPVPRLVPRDVRHNGPSSASRRPGPGESLANSSEGRPLRVCGEGCPCCQNESPTMSGDASSNLVRDKAQSWPISLRRPSRKNQKSG